MDHVPPEPPAPPVIRSVPRDVVAQKGLYVPGSLRPRGRDGDWRPLREAPAAGVTLSLSVSRDQNRHSKSVFTLSERGPSDAQACIPQRRQPLPTFRRGDPVLLDAGITNRCQQSLSVSRDTRTFWGAAVCAWTVGATRAPATTRRPTGPPGQCGAAWGCVCRLRASRGTPLFQPAVHTELVGRRDVVLAPGTAHGLLRSFQPNFLTGFLPPKVQGR